MSLIPACVCVHMRVYVCVRPSLLLASLARFSLPACRRRTPSIPGYPSQSIRAFSPQTPPLLLTEMLAPFFAAQAAPHSQHCAPARRRTIAQGKTGLRNTARLADGRPIVTPHHPADEIVGRGWAVGAYML